MKEDKPNFRDYKTKSTGLIYIIIVPEEEKRKNKEGKLFEEIPAKHFPLLLKKPYRSKKLGNLQQDKYKEKHT